MRDMITRIGDCECVDIALYHRYSLCKRRFGYVFARLPHGIGINIDGRHLRIWAALCHHERYESRTRTDVEHTLSATRPRAEQRAVGAHLHGTALLSDHKAFELEVVITHIRGAKIVKNEENAKLFDLSLGCSQKNR